MPNPKCSICEEEFAQERFVLGYDTCLSCAEKHTKRFLGRRSSDTKHGELTIFRTNLDSVRAVLKRETNAGFNANLSFGSYATPEPKDKEE